MILDVTLNGYIIFTVGRWSNIGEKLSFNSIRKFFGFFSFDQVLLSFVFTSCFQLSVLPCRYMSSGFTDVPFFQRGSVLKERAVDHVSFVLTPRGLLGNLKFTAKYQQIKQLQRLHLMFYALNELSLILCAKNCISVIYISYSDVYINALYNLVIGVAQHHSPSVFFFWTQPSCDAAIDLHTGDSDDGIITGVCLDTTRHAYLHSCEV